MGAKCDFLVTLITFVLSLAEMGSDIWLLYHYHTGGDTYWFWFTFVVVFVPSVVVNYLSVGFYLENGLSPAQWTIRIIVELLQLSTPFRYGKL